MTAVISGLIASIVVGTCGWVLERRRERVRREEVAMRNLRAYEKLRGHRDR